MGSKFSVLGIPEGDTVYPIAYISRPPSTLIFEMPVSSKVSAQNSSTDLLDEEKSSIDIPQANFPKHEVAIIRRRAMDLLARREHSFCELKRKLNDRLEIEGDWKITAVLERLREQGLQSDSRFVENYVRYRSCKGFGYLHIKQDLQARGVDSALIDCFLNPQEQFWREQLERLVSKKLPANDTIVFAGKGHRRLVRFLRSRGFESEAITNCLAGRLSL